MAAEGLPKEIYKTWECSLMFTSKWALETDLWNIEKKKSPIYGRDGFCGKLLKKV